MAYDKNEVKLLVGALWAKFSQYSQSVLLVFLSAHPKVFPVFHHISEDSATYENHVLPSGRILNPDLELGQAVGVTFENAFKVQLLDLTLKTRGKS